jgi:hypothetical protein
VLTLEDHRRKTKIMDEELRIVREERKRRQRFETATKTIVDVCSRMRQFSDETLFGIPELSFASDNIVAHLHDTKEDSVVLSVTRPAGAMEFSIAERDRYWIANLDKFKSMVKTHEPIGAFVEVSYHPQIVDNSTMTLTDPLGAIHSLWKSYEDLLPHRELIDPLDPTLLDSVRETLEAMMETVYNSIVTAVQHRIKFMQTDKSQEIYEKLVDQILGMDSIRSSLKKMREFSGSRLPLVQTQLFGKT